MCFLGDGRSKKCSTHLEFWFIIYLEIHLYFYRDETKVTDYFKSISPFFRANM